MNISFDVKRIDDSLEKRKYMPLLLLADEQQSMIYRYLDSGTMYVMTNEKGDTVAQCVVAHDHGSKTAEIKSISVASEYQRRGYGKNSSDTSKMFTAAAAIRSKSGRGTAL